MTNLLILAGGGGGALLLIVIMVLVGRKSRSPMSVAVVPPTHVEITPVVQMAPPTRVARGSVEFPTSEKRPTRGIRPSHAGRAVRTP